ncbi:bacterio-opsin activator domain-containing protein [Natrinema salsiterrestre]|uniref:Helix-turn-helix domain-containing protein n=1 Tax=Natrinema salsiterrestre TaxID=2950540 RepID=A0A9Q4KZD3_9EURY|nr:bacterio-opsin activator domain-containing protein [Natrinema salsiterrestre]MDF9744592.1 helix-turn-helix domain-containing protein [Natrinema salsiterrestre]
MGKHWHWNEPDPIADGGDVIDRLWPSSTVDSGAYELDSQYRFAAVDDGMTALTGYERDALLGEHVSMVFAEDTADSVEELVRTLSSIGPGSTDTDSETGDQTVPPAEAAITLEAPLATSGGESLPCTHQFRRLEDPAEPDRIAGTVRAAASSSTESSSPDREPADRAPTTAAAPDRTADQSTARTPAPRELLVHHAGGFYTLDTDCRYTFLNDRAAELLGVDDDRSYPVEPTESVDAESVPSPASPFDAAHDRALSLQRPIAVEEYHEPTSSWLEARLFPTEIGLAVHLSDVSHRKAYERTLEAENRRLKRELECQRDRRTTLEGVTDVVHEITAAVVEGSTREELERVTCETLAGFSEYEFAFVAAVDAKTGDIRNRVEAGVDGYVEAIPLSTDPDDPAGRGPFGRAIRTQSMQVSTDVFTDPDFEPWRDDAREHGYRSAAAIPITHEGTLYGALGLTSANPAVFEGDTRDVIGQLGDILGHAIAARDRKRALVSDDLIELDYEIRNAFELFDAPPTDERIRFDRVVRIAEDRFLEYGTTTPAALPAFERLVDQVPHWDEVTVLDESDDTVTFELKITSPPMFSAVADHGGYVEQAVLEDGDYTMTVHLPRRTDVRAVTAAIQQVYPGAENVARRQITPATQSIDRIQDHLSQALTDRQRTVLETAYYAGFFEWPRVSTGEEIADRLEISPATFHEHLRAAQRKLVVTVVDSPGSILRDAADE